MEDGELHFTLIVSESLDRVVEKLHVVDVVSEGGLLEEMRARNFHLVSLVVENDQIALVLFVGIRKADLYPLPLAYFDNDLSLFPVERLEGKEVLQGENAAEDDSHQSGLFLGFEDLPQLLFVALHLLQGEYLGGQSDAVLQGLHGISDFVGVMVHVLDELGLLRVGTVPQEQGLIQVEN